MKGWVKMALPADEMPNAGITITLCMIVKNEENTIQRCLDSVKSLIDEIIIVDTGSTDRTREITSSYTEKIYDFEWIDDFAAARNFSFSQATMDYIFWLDADDVLNPSERLKLVELKTTLDASMDAVTMVYCITHDEYGNTIHSVRRTRLVKRSRNYRWVGAVHEDLLVEGNVYNSDITVTHEPEQHDIRRNLDIFEKRLAANDSFTAREIFLFANELYDNQMYDRAIQYYRKFLDLQTDWSELALLGYGKMAECYNQLGDPDKEIESVLKTFKYDLPRAEYCCKLGSHFAQLDKWKLALFWFNLATTLEKPEYLQILTDACWTWYPHQELGVCYARLGDYQRAYEHNEIALGYRPNDPQLLERKRVLTGMFG